MLKAYWFIIIQSTLQSNLIANGSATGLYKWKEYSIPSDSPLSLIIKSVPVGRKQLDWDQFFEYIIPSTKIKLTESQSDEIIRFWSQGNEHMRLGTKSKKLVCLDYVREITEIILSPKEDWEPRIIKLFKGATWCSVFVWPGTRIDFLQSLNQFLLLEFIPWKVLHKTHVELLKMKAGVFGCAERELLDKTLALNERRYKKCIGNLIPGSDLNDFVAFHKQSGQYGISLVGKWSPGDQKALFQFWLHEQGKAYFETRRNPQLQLVVETEIVQGRTIKEIKTIKSMGPKFPTILIDVAYSKLREHSRTVVNYIESLDKVSDMEKFISTQTKEVIYGLEIPGDMALTNKMKIIEFWSRYVDIFPNIKESKGTKPLQKAIEDLVVKDFDEICMMMRNFLDQPENDAPIKTKPYLLQFLEFYSNLSPSDENSKFAKGAISQFWEPEPAGKWWNISSWLKYLL